MKIYAITLMLLLPTIALAFDSLDVKTEEELVVMNERDLSREAGLGCAYYIHELMLIREGKRPPSVGGPYHTSIGRALIKQGKTTTPTWYVETSNAMMGDDVQACFTPCIRLLDKEQQRLLGILRAQRAQKR